MMRLLLELMKDSKRSDRELAKVLDVSQPTVTRMRQRLVKEGIIREFTVIPDFVKMGYTIMAISAFKSKVKGDIEELREKTIEWTKARSDIVFAARAQGMGKNSVVISMHKTYGDFSSFVLDLVVAGGDALEDIDTLLISLEGKIIKHFSMAYLAEQEEIF